MFYRCLTALLQAALLIALSDKLDVFGSNLKESMKHLTVQATVDGDDVFEKMRIQSNNYKEQTGKLAFG